MPSKTTEAYRGTLTAGEKRLFRERCIGGINPKVRCPLCNTRRQTREVQYRYCDEHLSWEQATLAVDCHTCKIRYGVVIHDPAHAAWEERTVSE